MAGAEEMDEAAARDRGGAEPRDLGHGGALAFELPQQRLAAARYRVGSVLTSSSNGEEVARWSATG